MVLLHPHCLVLQNLDLTLLVLLNFLFLVQMPLLDKGGQFASTRGHLGITINVKMANFAETMICNRNDFFAHLF